MRLPILILLFLVSSVSANAQLLLAFQGGESNPSDTWAYTSTGAGAEAFEESQSPPNVKSGSFSLVVGGTDPSGGSCFGGGAGNGAAIDNIFTFEDIDLSTYPAVPKTLEFWYGNRIPYCNGAGWDVGEDLIFTPIIDGTEADPIVLENGGGDLSLAIADHNYIYEVPECALSFGFKLQINLNRRDELLFLDDVSLTAAGNPEPVFLDAGPDGQVCPGNEITLTGTAEGDLGNVLWTGGAGSFSDPTSPTAVYTAGEAEEGTVVLTLTAITACGFTIESQTEILVTGSIPEASIISSLGDEICPGQIGQLTAFGGTEYLWSTGEDAEDIFIDSPGTYSVEVTNECGTDAAEIVIVPGDVISVSLTAQICPGESIILPDGSLADSAGIYEVLIETEADCDTLYTVEVAPVAPLSIASEEVSCDYEEETFVLTVTIDGGDPGSLTASGAEGGFAGPVFTSVPIAAGSEYSLTVSDANGCDSLVISGFEACICPAVAVLTGDTAICKGETAELLATFEGTGPFLLEYTDGTDLFTEVAESNTLQIPLSPDSTVTYTATQITDEVCTGNASGTAEITVLPLPDAGADTEATVCDNQPAAVLTDLLGGTPDPGGLWVYQFSDTLSGETVFPAEAPQGLYIYTADAGICGTDNAFLNLFIAEAPAAVIDDTYGLCPTGTVPIPVSYTGSLPATLTYTFNGAPQPPLVINQSDAAIIAAAAGTYTLTGADDGTCASQGTGTAEVELLPAPVAEFERFFIGNVRGSDVFGFSVFNPLPDRMYLWEFFDIGNDGGPMRFAEAEGPEVQLALRGRNGGLFRGCLEVISAEGCTSTTCADFELIPEQYFFMPNAFSPDGDGINDLFFPVMRGYEDYTFDFRIYDRNGSLVFSTDNPEKKWNGSLNGGTHYVGTGIYTWRVEMNPRSSAGSVVKQGHVTLLR